MSLSIQGYFTGFSSKVDKTVTLRFNSQELPPEVYQKLAEMQGSFGTLSFEEEVSGNALDLKEAL